MKNNKIILLGIAVSVLFTCCIWLAVIGSLDQKPVTPTQPPQAANPPPQAEIYRSEIAKNITMMANGFKILEPLLGNPQLNNDDWILAASVAITSIREAHNGIIRAEPPPKLINAHSFLVDATSDCSQAMDFLSDAIDKYNEASANQSRDLIMSCAQKLKKANEVIQKVH